MLVDDSSICNLMLRKVLGRLPFEMEMHDFTNPVQALEQVQRLNPAVIMLDLNMPELDGWGFLEQMKASGLTNKVVILTSSTSQIDRTRCANFKNVLAYHNKPLSADVVNQLSQAFSTELHR